MEDMDKAVGSTKEMASQLKKINEIAYNQYKPIVSDLCGRVAIAYQISSYREIWDTE